MAASCSMIAAHPESQIGLPEALVGLIPGGTGTLIMRQRGQGSAKQLADTITTLAQGSVSVCADQARTMGFLRREDVTIYHPDRLIPEAKRLALSAVPGRSKDWPLVGGPVSGMIDQSVQEHKKAGSMTDHDIQIARWLKDAMVKSTNFDDALTRERQGFLVLCQEGLTLARINHMLESGRPLRN